VHFPEAHLAPAQRIWTVPGRKRGRAALKLSALCACLLLAGAPQTASADNFLDAIFHIFEMLLGGGSDDPVAPPVAAVVAAPPPPDTTAPTVNITSPGEGATVSGTISVTAGASDNVGVAGVQFKIDGVNLGGEVTTPPYKVSAFTTTTSNGAHILTAIARDAAGNRTTSTPVTLTVANNSATNVVDPAAVSYTCTFQDSPTDCGFGEQGLVGGRATLVNVARSGATGVRLHTEPGDINVAGSGTDAERNDISLSQTATGCFEGTEQWWAHSVLFPDDFVVPPPSPAPYSWHVVFDFHHTGATGQANFHVEVVRDQGLRLRVAGGAVPITNADESLTIVALGPIKKNVWYDFVYHVKWSSGGDGYFDAWVNGTQKMAHRGPTLWSGQGCYLKLANYHSVFGLPNSVIHDRVVLGSVPEAVSLTTLENILTIVPVVPVLPGLPAIIGLP